MGRDNQVTRKSVDFICTLVPFSAEVYYTCLILSSFSCLTAHNAKIILLQVDGVA